MGTKVWNFFLPASGAHQLRVENIGIAGQQVFIDGELQTTREALMFSGPGTSLLELRCQEKHGWKTWSLLVNGNHVEDYCLGRRASGDESLRELKGRADGSYLICPNFEVPDLEAHVIRKFRFKAGADIHEVGVAHSDAVWQVVYDGSLVAREVHRLSAASGEVSFNVEVSPGLHIPVVLCMTWDTARRNWHYALSVNSVDVEAYWIKGENLPVAEPVAVLREVPAPPPSPDIAHAKGIDNLQQVNNPCFADTPLPQGVSFDEAAGKFQATIRNAAGKFVLLGSFGTADEAHQKYLEAVPLHCPEKHIVPSIPS